MATNNWMTPLGGTTTGGPTQQPWDPSGLLSTSIWIDIDALGLSNGTGITTMTDQSGNGYDLTGTSTYATVVSADLNGLDVAQFNDLGGYTLSNWAGPFGNDGQVFAGVVEIDAVGGNSYISDTRSSVPTAQLTSLIYRANQTLTPSNQRRDGADTGVNLTASIPDTTGWAIVVLAHDYTNGSINCLVNGTSVATGTLTSTGSGPETNLTVGLGSSAVNTAPWEHKIAEAIFFDDRLSTGSTGDLERVEGYLAHKWGLTANLPSGHPYKSSPPVWAQASGGTETTSGGYKYHTFTSSGTLTVSIAGNVQYLVVGGGGGGGAWYGGGGGAGGAATGTAAVSTGSYSVTIGAGGTAGAHFTTQGGDGADSTFVGTGVSITGGGGGGGASNASNGKAGGGSGGGGAGSSTTTASAGGVAGTDGASNAGGGATLQSGANRGGGGGGGAAAAGTANTSSPLSGGDGGDGIEWPSVSGIYYAGGGGGGVQSTSGTGGSGGTGGGGDGVTEASSAAVDGTANTGGGGGAHPRDGTPGTGGSGIVIVRYKV